MHVNIVISRDEIEGTRVPDTDQSWGPGEVLQPWQAGMRFGRQVDNIILELNRLFILPLGPDYVLD